MSKPSNLFNVSLPEVSLLARFVLERLGRAEWLRVPWVHANFPLDLEKDIREDAAYFSASVMADASVVSLAIRLSYPERASLFQLFGTFAFYPTATVEQLATLLTDKGFMRMDLTERDLTSAQVEPTKLEATRRLLGTPHSEKQLPFMQALLLELIEQAPEDAALVIARDPLSLCRLLVAPSAERARVAAAVGTLARSLATGQATPGSSAQVLAALLKYCAAAPKPEVLIERFAAYVPLVDFALPQLSTKSARSLFPRCTPAKKLWLVERDGNLVDLAVGDPDPTVRAAAAPRVSAPVHIATLLSDDTPAVRLALARNARLDAAATATLYGNGTSDQDGDLALALARHASADSALLDALCAHPRVDVRCKVAGHAHLGLEAMERLSQDPSHTTLQRLARRGDLPAKLRSLLRVHVDAVVRMVATAGDKLATPEELASIQEELRVEVRTTVAKETTDAETLACFAADHAAGVRVAVAGNAATPRASLDALSKEANGYVRVAVASNVHAGSEILGRLAVDADEHVRRAAASSVGKQLPGEAQRATSNGVVPEVEEILLDPLAASRRELGRQKGLPSAVAAALADDPDLKVRMQLVRSTATPAAILEWLAYDADPTVRASVAACPRLPPRLLHVLLEDEHFVVRAAARTRVAKAKPAVSTAQKMAAPAKAKRST